MPDHSAIDPFLLSRFRCPLCAATPLSQAGDELTCHGCGTRYPVSHGRPVLFRPDNDMFAADDYRRPPALPGDGGGKRGLARYVPEPSVNLAAHRVVPHLSTLLPGHAAILVVGAGGQRAWVDPMLGAAGRRIVYCDVDVRASVDLFCDGHDLPFVDGSFDAVVTTAVLEHVINPERVAAEIGRVVKLGGYLYSELPFMQQVHEGAYDFTRYTLSGHRRLFRNFEEVEAGMVAGPGTTLAWSIENFLLAFARAPRARLATKALARIGFSWLKRFDRMLVDRPEAMDGASCTYLLGRRSAVPLTNRSIVDRYVGAKHLSHT
ncbi:SAM-dependent methyltransferase [Sphingomonas jinjuensis]|uniref:SAM-dependent methyltransferase n=1 Tax=Sphingomonas jinjuensis TaxID=535907 RepID=A0A840FHH6_9SPHN|nr:methyltransferase domain-containing protein [Sphingomonas jinjuensis]MBB4155137.1 SAM-dependent methyltransferase [Sphingomonas jinjuensis]